MLNKAKTPAFPYIDKDHMIGLLTKTPSAPKAIHFITSVPLSMDESTKTSTLGLTFLTAVAIDSRTSVAVAVNPSFWLLPLETQIT